jgi:hypothetical protein
MASFCDFEFRVRGKKKAVKAFYESTPYLDWKDAEYEGGTESNYEMHFKGNCKWSINFDVEDDCDDVTVINEFILRQQKNYDSEIVVEVMPLDNFYVAEEYHQDYLDKNPSGYCHLPLELFEYAKNVLFEKDR